MIPDLTFLRDAFSRFNILIFGESLPEPRFVLTSARTFRGKLSWRRSSLLRGRRPVDFELRLSTLFDLPQREWEDVVIHEMIHLHIASRGLRDSSPHGPLFRETMERINRTHDRSIVVSARGDSKGDSRVRAHYLCIVRFSDGRLGVAPVAKSRIFELWDTFTAWPEVSAVSWVGSTDVWFNRFPRVMRTKVYITSPADLLPHLKGGVRLGKTGGCVRVVSRHCSPDELLP